MKELFTYVPPTATPHLIHLLTIKSVQLAICTSIWMPLQVAVYINKPS